MHNLSAQKVAQALNAFLGLSQEQIAHEIGVSFSTVNAWCTGKRSARSTSRERLEALFAREIEARPADDVAAVAALTHAAYGSPRLGNQDDPLDELFFILLSLKTSYLTYEGTYEHFAAKFRPWRKLLDVRPDDVEAHIRRGGLGSIKARAFVDIAKRLKADFGEVSLRRLSAMKDEDAERYLTSLPGVGIKTARCVLMYALDRQLLPVDAHTYRVGVRLGLVPTSKSSAAVHEAFAATVPEHLRYAIHTNFVALGRDVCRDPVPDCDACVLRSRCEYSARRHPSLHVNDRELGWSEAPQASDGKGTLTAIDLYAGSGGLSAGIDDAGFDVSYALDWDSHACETHDANFSGNIDCADVRGITGRHITSQAGGGIDLVAGGPNCQGVSERGVRSPDDPRNFMFPEFVRLVGELRPAAFIMENVPGLTHRHNFDLLRTIFRAFEEDLGYRCAADVLLAADFGVPQLRYRFFLVGTLTDAPLTFPLPTHRPAAELRRHPGQEDYVTVWDAIGDLPGIDARRQDDEPLPYSTREPENEFQTYARKGSEAVLNHVTSATSELNLRRASFIPEGGNWKDIPPELLPDRFFMSRMTDHSTTYARLRRDDPAYTITALFGNITAGAFTHPLQNRALSVREGARLQSFRDTFVFRGPRNSQYRQIGNAVPPLLANAVARHLRSNLLGEEVAGRDARITSSVLSDKRAWDALPVLTPRFKANFGQGTRWPLGWGAEPEDMAEKLDDNYRLRREHWPEAVRNGAKKPA